MSARIERKRFLQASDGVNTCLPDASGAQSISSGLWTTCTNAAQGASIFALQAWKAICYLYGLILDLQANTPVRVPGAVSIVVGLAAGDNAVATVTGNDTAGIINLTTGDAGILSSNVLFTLHFATPYTTAGTLMLIPRSANALPIAPINATTGVATSVVVPGGIALDGPSVPYEWGYVIAGGT